MNNMLVLIDNRDNCSLLSVYESIDDIIFKVNTNDELPPEGFRYGGNHVVELVKMETYS